MRRVALFAISLAGLSLTNLGAVTPASAGYYNYDDGYYRTGYYGAHRHRYCCYDGGVGYRGLLTYPQTYYAPTVRYYVPTCHRQRIYDGRGGWVWGYSLECYQ